LFMQIQRWHHEIVETYKRRARILRDDVGTGSAINTGVLNSSRRILVPQPPPTQIGKKVKIAVLVGVPRRYEVRS